METLTKTAALNASDEALIQQFKDGSREALDVLFHRHLPAVYRRVRFVIPAEDVDDVTQDVFFAAHTSLRSFRGEAQFSTWLRTLTNHKVAEFYRRRTRKQEPPLSPLSEASVRSENDIRKTTEDRILVQRVLQKLTEHHREVILLRFAEDLQFNEIAEVTGSNLEAVKSLFRRAITALRELLEEEDLDLGNANNR